MARRKNPAVIPRPESSLPEGQRRRGGRYLTPTGEDLTNQVRASLTVDAHPHGPRGSVAMEVSDASATMPRTGQCIRTNMFRHNAGWRWVEGKVPLGLVKDNTASTRAAKKGLPPVFVEAIVSVEGKAPHGTKKDHFYTLRLEGHVPVALVTYPGGQPTLRPTMRGALRFGKPVGTIRTGQKEHPLYDVIHVDPSEVPSRGNCPGSRANTRENPVTGHRDLTVARAKRIGDEIGVRWGKITPRTLRAGMLVEFEHGRHGPGGRKTNVTGDDPRKTAKIAWAHLLERPDYYVLLAKHVERDNPSRFAELAAKIATSYRRKGYSAAEADRIGRATAYKVGASKYGRRGMAARAAKGRAKARGSR